MTYGQMMTNLIKKYDVDSYEVLKFKLMWLSYKSRGKITYADIEAYYNKQINSVMRKNPLTKKK